MLIDYGQRGKGDASTFLRGPEKSFRVLRARHKFAPF